ncbi:MAG: hypothetical protein V4474_03980 [Patescibacteria group bacterium]
MTKWIVGVIVVIIIAVGALWFIRPTFITHLFGGTSTPPPDQTQNDPLAGWGSYASSTMGISMRYAPGYTPNESYANTTVNPKKPIAGVQFVVPTSVATGTNLSSDTYMSVEQLPRANACTGDIFVSASVSAHEVTDGGIIYSVATTSDAAAGNRYEETIYAIKDSKPCTAVRYFVHYGAFDNYPAGTVQEFNRDALLAQFDQMRRTLQLTGAAATDTTTTP